METAKQTTLTVNGVNVTQLFDTIEGIKDNPEVSKFKFRATNRWQAGTKIAQQCNHSIEPCKKTPVGKR